MKPPFAALFGSLELRRWLRPRLEMGWQVGVGVKRARREVKRERREESNGIGGRDGRRGEERGDVRRKNPRRLSDVQPKLDESGVAVRPEAEEGDRLGDLEQLLAARDGGVEAALRPPGVILARRLSDRPVPLNAVEERLGHHHGRVRDYHVQETAMRESLARRREEHRSSEFAGVDHAGGDVRTAQPDLDEAHGEVGRRKVAWPTGVEELEEGVGTGGGRGTRRRRGRGELGGELLRHFGEGAEVGGRHAEIDVGVDSRRVADHRRGVPRLRWERVGVGLDTIASVRLRSDPRLEGGRCEEGVEGRSGQVATVDRVGGGARWLWKVVGVVDARRCKASLGGSGAGRRRMGDDGGTGR